MLCVRSKNIQKMKEELFNYLKDEHDVILLDTDIEAIIRIVKKSNDKIIDTIKKIKVREEEVWKQSVFCREHNFNLEAEKFKAIEDELRKIARQIENDFDTGYISLKNDA